MSNSGISLRGQAFKDDISYLRIRVRESTGATAVDWDGRNPGGSLLSGSKTITGTTTNLFADPHWAQPEAGDNAAIFTEFGDLWNPLRLTSGKGLLVMCSHKWNTFGGAQTNVIFGNVVNTNGGVALDVFHNPQPNGNVQLRAAFQKIGAGSAISQAFTGVLAAEASGGDTVRNICAYFDFDAYQTHIAYDGNWGNANTSTPGGGTAWNNSSSSKLSPCLFAGTNTGNATSANLNSADTGAQVGDHSVRDILVVEDVNKKYYNQLQSIYAQYNDAPWEVPSEWRA